MSRPVSATIDLNALRQNFRTASSLAPNSYNAAVIKADAYGHGAVRVAKTLENETEAFAVACIEEALELKDAGVQTPILLLEGVFSVRELEVVAANSFWLMLTCAEQLAMIESATLSSLVHVWLKLDVGMHRLGFSPSEFKATYERLSQSKNVHPDIILTTHHSSADSSSGTVQEKEHRIFRNQVRSLPTLLSQANSASIIRWPETHASWNRPGIMLYGVSPFQTDIETDVILNPVMTLISAIINLRQIKKGEGVGYGHTWTATRPSMIATLAIGYADGYPRTASNGTPTLLRGRRAPLVGTISMDMLTIDVTDIPDACIGDEVEMWGKHISVSEVASHASTSPYQLVAQLGKRVPRIYQDS